MTPARHLGWLVACVMGIGATATATAGTCYVVLDRNDTVIYRDVTPPFDLSETKSPERAALRKRGEHLIVADFDKCEPAGFISPTTGSTTASVEDIVTQLKPAIAPSVGSRQATATAPAAYGKGK